MGLKKIDRGLLVRELAKGLALPNKNAIEEGLAQVQLVKRATVKKGMATVNHFDGLAVPDGTGGLWTVPLFERWPHLLDSLGFGVHTRLAVLMVDLSGFSKETADLSPEAIRELLDPFYDHAVMTVEAAGGVVEKFVGDAVICVFGHPFRSEKDRDLATTASDLRSAVSVAQDCIKWSHRQFGGTMTAKAAVTCGDVFVGWVGPKSYSDLTVIGKPLTEMFRLEAVAPSMGIIMPRWFFDQNLKETTRWAGPGERAAWVHGEGREDLRGVGRLDVTTLTYNPD